MEIIHCNDFMFNTISGEIPYSELKRFEEHFDHYCIFAKKNSNLR